MNIRTLSLAIAVLLLAAGCIRQSPAVDEVGPHVAVAGEAKVEVVPDQLTVRFSVTELADEVAAATASVTRRTAAALEAARAAGVADEDLRALAVSIQPQWDWRDGDRHFRGHLATRAVQMTVRDIDGWPRLLDALVDAGVDRVDSVEPEHSDRQAIAREALRAAVADARARADVLADAAGVAVAGVFSLTETGRHYTVATRNEAQAMRTADAPEPEQAYEPGTITLTSNVQATFRLDVRR